MHIKLDDLSSPQIQELLLHHLSHLSSISKPCSMHALNLEALRSPNISFWSVWSGNSVPELMGCGALKQLDDAHGEIKSMRTVAVYLRKGVASHLLTHIIAEAKRRGYRRLSLETGAGAHFIPAQRLYAKFGFRQCGPFADYLEDPNSVFMTMNL